MEAFKHGGGYQKLGTATNGTVVNDDDGRLGSYALQPATIETPSVP